MSKRRQRGSDREESASASGSGSGSGSGSESDGSSRSGSKSEGHASDEQLDVDVDDMTQEAKEKLLLEEKEFAQQTHAARRELRMKYRAHITHQEELMASLSTVTAESLSTQVAATNQLYSQVRAPHEATLDSKAMNLLAKMGEQKTRGMAGSLGNFQFDLSTYTDALKRITLANLGMMAFQTSSKKIAGPNFMLGPLAIVHNKRKVAQRRKIVKDASLKVKPQDIQEGDIQRAENETTSNVSMISDLLVKHGGVDGINFFRFVINPESFGQTVENIFYLSFLIRDSLASIDDSEGDLILMATDKPTEEDRQAEEFSKRQIVMSIDQEMFEIAIEAYEIKHSLIPTRHDKSHLTKIANGMVG